MASHIKKQRTSRTLLGRAMVSISDWVNGKRKIVATRSAQVVMEINWDKLKPYMENAVGSKGGKCQIAKGAIVMRVVKYTVRETKVS